MIAGLAAMGTVIAALLATVYCRRVRHQPVAAAASPENNVAVSNPAFVVQAPRTQPRRQPEADGGDIVADPVYASVDYSAMNAGGYDTVNMYDTRGDRRDPARTYAALSQDHGVYETTA